VEIHLGSGDRLYKATFPLNSSRSTDVGFSCTTAAEAHPARFSGTMRRDAIIEVAVPYKDIRVDVGQELRLAIVVLDHHLEVARYPHHSPVTITRPGDDFEATMWRV
jgi:hypothetical protein